jgi:hypothetical protein
MAKDPPPKEWTKDELDALYPTIDDLQPRSGLRIMTEAEVMAMCTSPQEICGDLDILTLRRHPKIRRRGKARASKGQLNLNLKQGTDR